MKTITIRLPDVEAAMLVEVQKGNKAFKDLQQLLIQHQRGLCCCCWKQPRSFHIEGSERCRTADAKGYYAPV